jgi:hypothetical protein
MLNEITKARTTNCYFQMMAINPKSVATQLSLVTGSEACSSIMDAPHEYFDPTGKGPHSESAGGQQLGGRREIGCGGALGRGTDYLDP